MTVSSQVAGSGHSESHLEPSFLHLLVQFEILVSLGAALWSGLGSCSTRLITVGREVESLSGQAWVPLTSFNDTGTGSLSREN